MPQSPQFRSAPPSSLGDTMESATFAFAPCPSWALVLFTVLSPEGPAPWESFPLSLSRTNLLSLGALSFS